MVISICFRGATFRGRQLFREYIVLEAKIPFPNDLTFFLYLAVEQSDAQLELELRKADVVCVVYAVDDEDTLDSVTDHWLPFIERTLGFEHHTPIILVGNKVDLAEYRLIIFRKSPSVYNLNRKSIITIKKRILQFTNLKCCIKAKEPF